MGYYTTFRGEITIDPPLKWSEIKQLSEEFWRPFNFDRDVLLDLSEITTDTDDGLLTTRTARGIIPGTDESYKGYNIQTHIQEIVTAFPDRRFAGQIIGEGEEAGDIRRYVVKDGKVIEQQATFTFPDNE